MTRPDEPARDGYLPVPCPPPPRRPMNVKAVITCVDYADFLAYTLPHNRCQFDYTVVVTAPGDKATQRLCEYWNVHCHVTDAFHAGGAGFHKGAGINAGLRALGDCDWVCHMDADILLPPIARRMIEAAQPDPEFLFGIDRANVPDFEAWAEHLANPGLQQENETFVHFGAFRTGTRVARPSQGYIPIGFFQLWNARVSGVREYPEEHTSAARGDEAFALKWPRGRRGFLPEVIAYHLESGPAEMGANWDGRATPPFRPKPYCP